MENLKTSKCSPAQEITKCICCVIYDSKHINRYSGIRSRTPSMAKSIPLSVTVHHPRIGFICDVIYWFSNQVNGFEFNKIYLR